MFNSPISPEEHADNLLKSWSREKTISHVEYVLSKDFGLSLKLRPYWNKMLEYLIFYK